MRAGYFRRILAWLNAPLYELPPEPKDANTRGLGWGGYRPPTRSDAGQDIVTRHENIRHGKLQAGAPSPEDGKR